MSQCLYAAFTILNRHLVDADGTRSPEPISANLLCSRWCFWHILEKWL